jgi:MFS family permease
MEFLCNAITTIWLSSRLAHLSPRVLTLGGLALFFAGNVACSLGGAYWPLVGAFALRGVGIGCLTNASSALAARIASPQRLLGASMPLQMAMIIAGPVIGGRLAPDYGQAGVFGVYAASALIALPMAIWTPLSALAPGGERNLAAEARHVAQSVVGLLRAPFVWSGVFSFLGLNAIWPFFAKVAELRGFSSAQTGDLIAVTTVGSGAIGIASALVRDDWVRRALLAAILVCGVSAALVPVAPSAGLLIAAFAVQAVSFVFLQNLYIV